MQTRFVILAVVGASAITGGSGAYIGYRYAEKKLMTTFDERLQEELETSRKYYTKMTKKEEFESPIEIVETIIPAPVEEIIVEEGYVVTGDEDIPFSKEPIVIPIDAFVANDLSYEQITLTYYEDDDVLTDEHDIPVDNIEDTIGLSCLEKFGHGSRNPNIVYVRNPWVETDFEVIRERGSYANAVAGTMKHSAGRPRKFRIDND